MRGSSDAEALRPRPGRDGRAVRLRSSLAALGAFARLTPTIPRDDLLVKQEPSLLAQKVLRHLEQFEATPVTAPVAADTKATAPAQGLYRGETSQLAGAEIAEAKAPARQPTSASLDLRIVTRDPEATQNTLLIKRSRSSEADNHGDERHSRKPR